MVISLLREANTNVSSTLLGWSVQLMLAYFYALFENDQNALIALDLYMTNNRLGTVISQEIYIAYLLKRTIEDLVNEENEKEVSLPKLPGIMRFSRQVKALLGGHNGAGSWTGP